MNIRKAERKDLDDILKIYASARQFMKETGNPSQWRDGYPAKSLLENDIEKGQLFAVEDQRDGKSALCGVFAFILGEDPTYAQIEGNWPNSDPYGTIHRIAGDGTRKGLLQLCVDFGLGITDQIRIDTHDDNKVMQHLIKKCGFAYCGRIYAQDHTPRLAYQLQKACAGATETVL